MRAVLSVGLLLLAGLSLLGALLILASVPVLWGRLGGVVRVEEVGLRLAAVLLLAWLGRLCFLGHQCLDGRRPVARLREWLRLPPRVLLGVFVLGQMLFLPAYNALEGADDLRKGLRESRENEGRLWGLVSRWPAVRDVLAEWLEKGDRKGDRGALGNAIGRARRVTRWWAQTAGQEQGWGLFSPDAYRWSSFASLELRWDAPGPGDPEGAGGRPLAGGREPVLLRSDNQPRDRHRFVRFGYFRLRRFETKFEIPLEGAWVLGQAPADWEGSIKRTAKDQREEILTYMHWKLLHFRREHPASLPTQVILRVQAWSIPEPPGPRPWDWVEWDPVPVARWLPREDLPRGGAALEWYNPTTRRFEEVPPDSE